MSRLTTDPHITQPLESPILPTLDRAKATSKDIMDIIRAELEANLGSLAQEAEQLDQFLTQIEPDVTAALASGDVLSLNLIKDRIAGRLLRKSLKTLARHSNRTLLTVMTVIRTLIRAGIAI